MAAEPEILENWNVRKSWTEMDLEDLRLCAMQKESVAYIACFLMRTEREVIDKIRELGLPHPALRKGCRTTWGR